MPRSRTAFVGAAMLLLLAMAPIACSTGRPHESNREPTVPLFEGLGDHGRKITTSSPEAQRYFDQGLSFLFAFNHEEAIRSFRKAAELDPHAAMAWWGIAIANGPHINFPMMLPEQSQAAWNALEHAKQESATGAATEKDLIAALGSRYAEPAPKDRAALDKAYADEMRKVWKRHPNDPDVGALFAEAMMDLRPWNQWTREGKAQPGTNEVLATLETVMKLQADHPLALHLYIHATEASRDPGRADAAANRLRDLQPGLGHLVHMPSHTDVRRGRWRESVTANAKAIRADDAYRAISPRQGFYAVYMAHNHHMLASSAMMIGRRAEAVAAIDTMASAMPPAWAKQNPAIADGFLAMPLEVRVRFGLWDEVLAAPEPEAIFPMARAMRHYARGVALSAKGDTAAARAEQAAFQTDSAAVPADELFQNNSARDVLGVADRILEGEISYREGKRDAALAALEQAVAREDALQYGEPPAWILPSRHTLGAALLDSGRAREAEKVFRADLVRLPNNGWSLFGLAASLRAQHRTADAARAEAEFQKAWAGADFAIASPCACLSPPAS